MFRYTNEVDMGVRSDLFMIPLTDVFDYSWFELKRLLEGCHEFGFSPLSKVTYEIELFTRSIEKYVDPRLVSGVKKIPTRSKPSVTLEARVCEIWNSIRTAILWTAHRVDTGQLPEDILVALLKLNKHMSSLVRLVNPLKECGTQKFTIRETTEVPPLEVEKIFRQGYVTQYARQKEISPTEIPISALSRSWKLPLHGWTRDLAEETGRLVGEIEGSGGYLARSGIDKDVKKKAEKLHGAVFQSAARFIAKVHAM